MPSDFENYGARGSNAGGFLLGLLAGAAIGGAIMFFYAPRSGKETREMLKNKAMETRDLLQERAEEMRDRLGRVKDSIKSSAEHEIHSVKGR
jgi:gas vesicle protein